jgi:hypothetical protein
MAELQLDNKGIELEELGAKAAFLGEKLVMLSLYHWSRKAELQLLAQLAAKDIEPRRSIVLWLRDLMSSYSLSINDKVMEEFHGLWCSCPTASLWFVEEFQKDLTAKLMEEFQTDLTEFLEEGLTADMVKKLMEEFQIPSAPVQNQGAREYESCAQVDNESFTHADDERNAPKEVKVLCVQQVGIKPSPKEVMVLRVQQVQNQGAREYESVCAPRRHGLCVHDFSPSADMARKLNFPQNPSAPVQNQGVCEYKSERKSLRTPHKPAILRTPHKPAIPRNAG